MRVPSSAGGLEPSEVVRAAERRTTTGRQGPCWGLAAGECSRTRAAGMDAGAMRYDGMGWEG